MGDLPDWQTRISTGDDDVLFTGTLSAGASLPVMDVSAYSSLQVFLVRGGVAQLSLGAVWQDTNGDPVTTDNLYAYPSALAVTWPSMQLPVRAPKVLLVNNSAIDLTVTVLGSQRHLSGLLGVGYADMDSKVLATQALVAGTFYPLGSNPVTLMQGWVQLELSLSNAAVTGSLVISNNTGVGSNTNMIIADTAEGVTDGTIRVVTKQVILPASQCYVQFLCRTAGTSAVVCNMASLGH